MTIRETAAKPNNTSGPEFSVHNEIQGTVGFVPDNTIRYFPVTNESEMQEICGDT